VTGAVIVFHDVGAARAMSLRMSYLTQHDFFTGPPNRMLFNDRLTQAIALARRHSWGAEDPVPDHAREVCDQ